MARAQLSITAGALGALAAIGFVKVGPQKVDAERVAQNVITVRGSNVVDGSLKFNDLNRSSIEKFIYLKNAVNKVFLKVEQAAATYLKIDDANAKFVKLDGLSDYIKLSDAEAKFVKVDTLSDYVKGAEAEAAFKWQVISDNFLKVTDADAKFVKVEALSDYIKLSDANAKFVKVEVLSDYIKAADADAKFLKQTDADATFLKQTDASSNYLKQTDAAAKYLKIDDASSIFAKIADITDFIKVTAADARYIGGHGSVHTGSVLLTKPDESAIMMQLPGVITVRGATSSLGNNAAFVTLKNESDAPLEYASSTGQSGQIDNGSTVSITGLGNTATVQITRHDDRPTDVHTLVISAFPESQGARLVGQLISAAPFVE
jgi:hypothetical protein